MAEIKNLSKLAIAALDQLSEIARLQLFLQITLDQLGDAADDKTSDKVNLLLRAYLPQVELCLEKLKVTLEQIRLLVKGVSVQDQQDS